MQVSFNLDWGGETSWVGWLELADDGLVGGLIVGGGVLAGALMGERHDTWGGVGLIWVGLSEVLAGVIWSLWTVLWVGWRVGSSCCTLHGLVQQMT